MRTPEVAKRLIVKSEGKTLYAYNDPVGFCTAGPGHLLHRSPCTSADYARYGTRKNPQMTDTQYYKLLDLLLVPREDAVKRLVNVPINACEFGALVSLVYNIGEGNFAKSTVLKELNKGHRSRAAAAFLMWNKGGFPARVLPGLRIRRLRERRLFLGKRRGVNCGKRVRV